LGSASLLAFGVFLVAGPLDIIDLKLGETRALTLDLALSLAFFVQHSVMVRPWFGKRLERILSPRLHGVVYTVASSILLIALVGLWQESTRLVADVPPPARWVMRGLVPAAGVTFLWAVRSLGKFDSFGLIAAKSGTGDAAEPQMPLTVRGAYRWVRHPMYLVVLMMIWSYPNLTADRLLFNVSWTGWVVVATFLEERDLAANFGDAYGEYRNRVPMLVPWRMPRH
jgi:protein-S-isoprenylcysteine O-methyltransferase Ste14